MPWLSRQKISVSQEAYIRRKSDETGECIAVIVRRVIEKAVKDELPDLTDQIVGV